MYDFLLILCKGTFYIGFYFVFWYYRLSVFIKYKIIKIIAAKAPNDVPTVPPAQAASHRTSLKVQQIKV